ncbi:Acetyl-CoA synthetase-like protein [Mycena venus]|uniref:Acetyl-CoA synthetase-like protein n=1 Tax=Mycena venus TaxID=2733690 RepID=A0A8H6YB05_9AGAR|nr:Acetyl-CoA synthetase-like protein [Mycena venus]
MRNHGRPTDRRRTPTNLLSLELRGSMPEFLSGITLPPVPEHLSLEEFILSEPTDGRYRPFRPGSAPWLISDTTGQNLHLDEIREKTAGLANGLHLQFGIEEDDVVLIISSNHIYYPLCIWALHRLRAIVSPCNPSSTVSELIHQLSQTHPSLIIAHKTVLNVALSSAREVDISEERIVILDDEEQYHRGFMTVANLTERGLRNPFDWMGRKMGPGEGRKKVAFFCASSGTTGKPKIVAISHFSAIANVVQIATLNRVNEAYTSSDTRRYRPGDRCLAVLPFYHIYGLVVAIHFVLFSGMTVVVVPKFNFEGMLKSIVRHKINQLMLVPPQVALLCKEPVVKNYDLSAVRAVLCAGAPLSSELNQQLIDLLPNAHIGQAYGQTESTGVVSMWPTRTKHGFNGGELAPGVRARIVKSDGTLAGYNEPGELLLKTPAAALGYFGNEEATNEAFVDGWLRTGDQVMINEENEVIYIDRLKEIMKVRGFQVSPAELEGCMLGHELVADVCVVGIPSDYSGEVPLAFVVPTAAAAAMMQQDPEAIFKAKKLIMEYVAKLKSPYKHIRRIEFVNEIPKNPSGKLLRRILRERAKGLAISSAKL